ncbi:MAG: ABC transporter substrate-binding protein [Pygmaiobacter sp.]|nr:ABC transporter substrate-binding protein [Pygmaiobacter sp.]
MKKKLSANNHKASCIALLCAGSMLLAGCGSTASSATAASASTPDSAAASTTATGEEPVTLRWVTTGTGMPKNYDAWAKEVNTYLAENYGVMVEMEVIPYGDWDSRRSVLVNTNSEFDIMFTNYRTFVNDVNIGAFASLSDLLETNAPDLMKLIPESYWDACRVNDEVYAVPTYKDSSATQFIIWDEDLLKEMDLDVSEVDTFEEMTPVLEKITEYKGEPAFPMFKNKNMFMGENFESVVMGLPISYDSKTKKVVYNLETETTLNELGIARDWYNKGIINADAATRPEDPGYKAAQVGQGWSGAAKTSWGPSMGVNAVAYQMGTTVVNNDTVRGSLNCVSASCQHPDKALVLLNAINTDTYLRDSFFYGLKGDDWDYTSDNRVHRNSTDWSMAGYTQATFFTVTPTDDVDFNQWDEVRTLNDNAVPSDLLGFNLDTSEIEDEIANCSEIWLRWRPELVTGTLDPVEGAKGAMEELRAAGSDKILETAQTQIDAFFAKKA